MSEQKVPGLMALDTVRFRLAVGWLIGGGGIVVVMALQSLFGRFGSQPADAWGWLLPTIMPTLLLIVSVLGYTALVPELSKSVVRRDFYLIARWLSDGYITLVALTVLVGPFAAPNGAGMVNLMHMSNLWLGPMQGLVASALGVLFVTKQSGGSSEKPAHNSPSG